MTKNRNISDLLDANGDVKSAALDNVPASNDASALTTGTLPIARIADGDIALAKFSATGTKDATTFLRGDNTFAVAGGTNTPAFMARLASSDQTFSNQTYVKVNMSTEVIDTDNNYDTSNYRFTPTVAGRYFISATGYVRTAGSHGTAAYMGLLIYKNGSQINGAHGGGDFQNNPGYGLRSSPNVLIDMNGSSDYLELYATGATYSSNNVTLPASETIWQGFKILE